MIPLEIADQHLGILGKTGSGKTYAAKGLVEQLLRESRRVCIIDPTGAWWGLQFKADRSDALAEICIFGGEHADVPITERSGERLAEIIASSRTPTIVDVSEFTVGERTRFATAFFAELYRLNRTPLHLVVDEADEFARQNPLPEHKRLFHEIDRIVRRGRVRGFRVMMISQRPAVLHKDVLTQSNALIAMRMTGPQDRKAIEEWVKGQADVEQAKQVLTTLAKLQRGEGWLWAPESDLLQRMTFPRIESFDSSSAPEQGNEVDAMPEHPWDFAALAEQLADGAPATLATSNEGEKINTVALRKAREDGFAAGQKDGYRQGYEKGYATGRDALARSIGSAARAILNECNLAIGTDEADSERASANSTPFMPPAPTEKPHPAPRPTNGTGKSLEVPEGTLTAPRMRILSALAWAESVNIGSLPRTQLAFFADASPTSSGFQNNLGALRTAGLIDYPEQGVVMLTDDGAAVAGPVERAFTSADLHDSIRSKLPAPQWRILEALIAHYPHAFDRETLADSVDASPTSSGFQNNLGSLRSLGLIDYPQKGRVKAEPLLFVEAPK